MYMNIMYINFLHEIHTEFKHFTEQIRIYNNNITAERVM